MSKAITTNIPRPLSLDERCALVDELADLETVLELTNEDSWSFEAVEKRVAEIKRALEEVTT